MHLHVRASIRPLAAASCAIALTLSATPAAATLFDMTSSLDGAQETPAVVTPATGFATGSYDDVTNLLTWSITYSDLIGTTTNAHFHGPAAPGVGPAGVQLGISFTSGVTAATLNGSGTITEAQEADLLAGLWYINIHSTFRTGGEIRGQVYLTAVPEPGTLLLLGGALAFVSGWRRTPRA
ncbi:MAG: CHRD protein [Proteobacteria bacterium]|nr:MAG: CHRD protein [Pseudomonadota bacterium]